MDPIDDETVAYVVERQRQFEDLKLVASQLAGLLVLTASGSKTVTPDHPMLRAAAALLEETVDETHRTRPTPSAREHHDCLRRASHALESALAEARNVFVQSETVERQLDRVLSPLQSAYAHLQQSAATLPGFEMVSFAHGCCGANRDGAGVRGRAQVTRDRAGVRGRAPIE